MEDFVQNGPGVDAYCEDDDAQPNEPRPRITRLTVDLPSDLHLEFKVDCTRRGVKMTDVFRKMIKARLRQAK